MSDKRVIACKVISGRGDRVWVEKLGPMKWDVLTDVLFFSWGGGMGLA